MSQRPSDVTIEVNGVQIYLPISKLEVGDSLFIPSTVPFNTRKALRKILRNSGYRMTYRDWVEQGTLGVRAWRVV